VTAAVEALEALRAAVTRGEEPTEGASSPAGVVSVARRADGELDSVRVTPAEPFAVEELAARFGPPAYLPRNPAGGRRALFPSTGPRDGERTTAVLAELDGAGRAAVVVLRPDDLRQVR
jgi:hypothetical protein